jgi:hypothetical protein
VSSAGSIHNSTSPRRKPLSRAVSGREASESKPFALNVEDGTELRDAICRNVSEPSCTSSRYQSGLVSMFRDGVGKPVMVLPTMEDGLSACSSTEPERDPLRHDMAGVHCEPPQFTQ